MTLITRNKIIKLLVALVIIVIFIFIGQIIYSIFYSAYFDTHVTETVAEPLDGTDIFKDSNNVCYSHLLDIKQQEVYQDCEKKNLNDCCQKLIMNASKKAPVVINRISDMNVPRVYQHSVLLNDGRVLIIGGNEGNTISSEIFDPKTKKFSLLNDDIRKPEKLGVYGEMPILLPEGKVYFAGKIFNPQTDKFSSDPQKLIKKTQAYSQPDLTRWQLIYYDLMHYSKEKFLIISETHKFITFNGEYIKLEKVFNDGKLLFSGNCSLPTEQNNLGICEDIFLVDPVTGKKFHRGKLKVKKSYFNVYRLYNDKFLIIHNDNSKDKCLYLEIYNPINGQTKLIKQNFEEHPDSSDVVLIDKNTIFFINNNDNKAFSLNLQSDQLTFLKSFYNINNYELKTGLLKDRFIYLIKEHLVYILDLSNKEVYMTWNYNVSNDGQNFIRLSNGDVLITGGYDKHSVYKIDRFRSKYAAIFSTK